MNVCQVAIEWMIFHLILIYQGLHHSFLQSRMTIFNHQLSMIQMMKGNLIIIWIV